jgi:hypothetical protein
VSVNARPFSVTAAGSRDGNTTSAVVLAGIATVRSKCPCSRFHDTAIGPRIES